MLSLSWLPIRPDAEAARTAVRPDTQRCGLTVHCRNELVRPAALPYRSRREVWMPMGFASDESWVVPLVGYVAIAYQNNRGFFLLAAGIVLILIALATALEARQGRRRRHSRRAAPAPAVIRQDGTR